MLGMTILSGPALFARVYHYFYVHHNGLIMLLSVNVDEYFNLFLGLLFEPSRGKTNNVVSEQVRHKPSCASTEDG